MHIAAVSGVERIEGLTEKKDIGRQSGLLCANGRDTRVLVQSNSDNIELRQ